jgi:hypothetical protein
MGISKDNGSMVSHVASSIGFNLIFNKPPVVKTCLNSFRVYERCRPVGLNEGAAKCVALVCPGLGNEQRNGTPDQEHGRAPQLGLCRMAGQELLTRALSAPSNPPA